MNVRDVAQADAGIAPVTLRPVTWRDIPRLADIETELFGPEAWSEATWWAELAGRPRREYLALVDGDDTLAGYAGLDHGGEVADVMTVAVVPSRRGAGLGDRLVAELVRRAAATNAEAVLLEVRADNAAAVRLYARQGFEQVAVRRHYYRPAGPPVVAGAAGVGAGSTDALVMRLALAPDDKSSVSRVGRDEQR